MATYANEYSGREQLGAQQYEQQFDTHQQVTENSAGGSSNDYNQQSEAEDQVQKQQLGQRYNEPGQQYTQGQQFNQEQKYSQGQQYNQGQQHNQGQQTNAQHQTNQTSDGRMHGNQAGQQQLGAGEPAQTTQQDSLHKCESEPSTSTPASSRKLT